MARMFNTPEKAEEDGAQNERQAFSVTTVQMSALFLG